MESQAQVKHIINVFKFSGACVLLLWSVHIVSLITDYRFASFGIYPRTLDGLKGIIFAPLVHSDLEHLFSNTFPFFVLTGVIYFFYKKVAIPSFIIIYILTGLVVWLFARPVYHIGASGVVYGLMSFILFSGIFRRNLKSIALALAVTVLYSGYFYGLVPLENGVSWESHLFGALVGVLVAFVFKSVIEEDEISPPGFEEEEKVHFLPRDTFDKTLRERELENLSDWSNQQEF